ncbi:heterocyst-inhibiting protein PatX [Halotia branconii]|uniref:Uncharacterized protein n=1 Tax=Halotia branconii CENA392 TaxID=1539056 RepID=A0AAJ6NVK0_9CYAN|nr:hypothetical protein [Halotia branconii]WGV27198.1 hypothetical protein QI031_06820 [Halotia branconii CENA392]
MRISVSLLVSILVFGSLAVNHQETVNKLSLVRLSSSDSQQLLSAKPKSNEPESPRPFRGSGRRDLIQSRG